MEKQFIKFIEPSENFYEVIKRRPTAFVLLALIAVRAKRSNSDKFSDLDIGQCFVGDFETYGVSEQQYRTDKLFLTKYQFATFKPTKRGTIARIVDTSIFDISRERVTITATDSQRSANDQLTTNREGKKEEGKNKEKNIKKESSAGPETVPDTASRELIAWIEHFNGVFKTKYKPVSSLQKNFNYWADQYELEEMKAAVSNAKLHDWWRNVATPEKLLRQKDQKGESCDRIGELSNYRVKGAYKRQSELSKITQEIYGTGTKGE